MPRTGGGDTLMTKRLLDRGELLVERADQRLRALPLLGALLEVGSSGVNTTAAFGAVVKVAPSRPTIGTAWAMPGVSSTILVTLRAISSVRASEAPGGKLDDVDQIALVLLRNEAGRRRDELIDGERDQPGIDHHHERRYAHEPAGQRAVARRDPLEGAVEAVEESA